MEQQEPLKAQRHDELQCPACKYDKLNSTLVLEGDRRAPAPGDVTICMECAAVLTYGDGLRLHVTPETTIKNALTDEQRQAIQNMQNYVFATAPLNKEIRELREKLEAAEKGRASAEACYAETLKTIAELRRGLAVSNEPCGTCDGAGCPACRPVPAPDCMDCGKTPCGCRS